MNAYNAQRSSFNFHTQSAIAPTQFNFKPPTLTPSDTRRGFTYSENRKINGACLVGDGGKQVLTPFR
ncbi:hypothetical protein RJT34_19233 [Clitoria ternatea]|uniref:Uncharacterized protein n=1 Tax=Clitoria ternatea TaxID=43366 RepID=A0AAN9IQN1_CLITE